VREGASQRRLKTQKTQGERNGVAAGGWSGETKKQWRGERENRKRKKKRRKASE
jgi:hypothetical protein